MLHRTINQTVFGFLIFIVACSPPTGRSVGEPHNVTEVPKAVPPGTGNDNPKFSFVGNDEQVEAERKSAACAAILSTKIDPLERFGRAIPVFQGGGIWIGEGDTKEAALWTQKIRELGMLEEIVYECPRNRIVVFVPGLTKESCDNFVEILRPEKAKARTSEYFCISPVEAKAWVKSYRDKPDLARITVGVLSRRALCHRAYQLVAAPGETLPWDADISPCTALPYARFACLADADQAACKRTLEKILPPLPSTH